LVPASGEDAVEHYEVQEEMHKDCEHCPTGVEAQYRKEGREKVCTIKTTRLLGRAGVVNDRSFLAGAAVWAVGLKVRQPSLRFFAELANLTSAFTLQSNK